ncbi:MAG: hypothetical protein ABIQ06_01560 [Caldimonas sp.]
MFVAIAQVGVEMAFALARPADPMQHLVGFRSELTGPLGSTRREIVEIQPWSDALAQGARQGDVFEPDHWYHFSTRERQRGESVGVTLWRDGQPRHVEFTTVPQPRSPSRVLLTVLNTGVCLAGIAFGLLVGLRYAGGAAGLALAMAMLLSATNSYPRHSPLELPFTLSTIAFYAALVPAWTFALVFTVLYGAVATPLRRALQRALPIYFALALLAMPIAILPGLGRYVPDPLAFSTCVVAVTMLSALAALWDGWRGSAGELRQRFAWLLGTFALLCAVNYLGFLPPMFDDDGQISALISSAGTLMAYMGLAYAVMRHRVLDIRVAVNRSLVVALAGAGLLAIFQALQIVVGRYLHFDDPRKAALLGGVLAGLVFLGFQRVRRVAEALVDRTVFRSWVEREETLRRFVTNAGAYTDTNALAGAMVAAADRFTGEVGVAVYVAESGRLRLVRSSIDGALPELEANDPILVALRATGGPVRCVDVHACGPGAWALPMLKRRPDQAVLLVGGHGSLRGDQLSALVEAASAVGSMFQVLRIIALEARVAATEIREGA